MIFVSNYKKIPQVFSLWNHPKQTSETIKTYQNQKLQQIIAHAYDNVPFYRDLFDRAKIKPQDIKTSEDLHALPLVRKQDLKHQPEERLVTQGVSLNHYNTFFTSGATGRPFAVRRSTFENFLYHVLRLRAIHNYGLKPSDKFLRIRGERYDELPLSWRLLQSVGIYRQVMLSTMESPESLAKIIRSEQPDILTGYSGALVRVAQILASLDDQDNRPVRPRFVVGGADALTPLGRHQISEAFRAPLYDNYESQEVGLIAWQCRESEHYHVCDDNVILEVLRNGSQVQEGEIGEVVVTSLHNYTMPFIRYCLEDLVLLGRQKCSCGWPLSTIRNLQGKTTEYFHLPFGRELNPWFIDGLIYTNALWIEHYEVIQERLDRILLRVVLPVEKSIESLEPLRTKVQTELGEGAEFKIEAVNEIKPGPSGKFFYHRSCVSPTDSVC